MAQIGAAQVVKTGLNLTLNPSPPWAAATIASQNRELATVFRSNTGVMIMFYITRNYPVFRQDYGPAATMKLLRITIPAAAVMLLAACAEEKQPRSVSEFIEHPILLEAALVRCTRNRAESRYDAECVNAREAVMLTEAQEDSARRAELEAQSKRKRDALRETQRARTVARRRVAEARRQREEAEYLAQFGVLPPIEEPVTEEYSGNVPMALIPDAEDRGATYSGEFDALPNVGSNAPVMEISPDEEPETDLESIRDELRRRNDEGNEQ